MVKIIKFRLFPTKGQRSLLRFTLEECRWLYNQILETRRDAYANDGVSLNLYDINPMIPGWKEERPSLRSVHSQALQNVSERIQLAFQAFFRRCQNGENPGYPRFRSEERYRSISFPQPGKGFRLVDDNGLRLYGIGTIRIKRHRPIPGTIKRLTVKREETGHWFACFHVEIEDQMSVVAHNIDAIGIDVGLENFATLSNGEVIENPRFLKRDRKRLRKLDKQFFQSPEGSERRNKKAKAKIKVWNRITNRRTNFAHQTSRRLVDRFGIICVEDLDIRNMVSDGINDFLNEGTHDAAWGRFIAMISYKAEEAGRVLVRVEPRGTSQDCSRCGERVPKELGVRIHDCPHCGLKIHRDLNASLNILRRGLTSLARAA